MNQKGYLSSILLIILLLLVGASFFFLKNIIKDDPPEFSPNQFFQDEPQPVKTSSLIQSPDKKYSLLINYEDDDRGKHSCKKTIYDQYGSEKHFENIDSFFGNVGCRLGRQISLDGFHNFSGDDMVFNLLGTDITILNVISGEIKTIRYTLDIESQNYFVAADTSLEYTMFSKSGYSYIDQIKNYEDKEVFSIQPLITNENNALITSYYDSINHGILYLYETDKAYQFKYFDLQSKKMRNLKSINRNLEAVGRGCGGNSLASEKGKLIFNGSCMDVLQKDKNESGEIILNL